MASAQSSVKHGLIGKANSTIVAVTSFACFVVIFSLVASNTLANQLKYQNRIISAKKHALSQLKQDISASDQLVTAYKKFVNTDKNVLGGNPAGSGNNDGDNARIVLDALPSKYDFPALATSLEKILVGQPILIQTIGGTDDEIAQSANQTSSTPAPIAIPFQVTVSGSYSAIQNVVGIFDRSIRPFQIKTMSLSGDESNLTLTITAETSYQPEKTLNIGSTVIK